MERAEKGMKERFIEFLKNDTVLVTAFFAAVCTMIAVPPNLQYFSYIDYRVLALLFSLMSVVNGLEMEGFFDVLSEALLKRVHNTRELVLSLVLLCFFSSMWITNDVSLLTFVPLAIMILKKVRGEQYLIFTIVMQTIGANLGSMLTPVGNPQNLYLYSRYPINPGEFFKITVPVVAVSLGLLILACGFVKKEKVEVSMGEGRKIRDRRNTAVFGVLFLLCLLCVLHIVDYRLMAAIILVSLFAVNKRLILTVDYGLLFTFVCFFVIVGNIGEIEAVKNVIGMFMEGREIPFALVLSQIISNVPAAVLLSAFTENYRALIVGTNIGGLGTLIASLASLISFKFYKRTEAADGKKYVLWFTVCNVIFLIVLCLFSFLFL